MSLAKDVAEDWYMELRNKERYGELSAGKTFREAAKVFEVEYEVPPTVGAALSGYKAIKTRLSRKYMRVN